MNEQTDVTLATSVYRHRLVGFHDSQHIMTELECITHAMQWCVCARVRVWGTRTLTGAALMPSVVCKFVT